jgi:hypothetical protein
MHPYNTDLVLHEVDNQAVVILLLCALALIGNYIMWIENLRHGFRGKIYTMPVPCVLFFLSHDATFVASYHVWFSDIDHWFPRLWWFGLILTVIMELAFLVMFLKFGRKELAPQLTRAAFVAATFFGLVITTIAWLVIKSVMDDQLYLIVFGFTVFWCSPWYFALTWRRKSAAGQTVTAWLGYLMMPIFYWPATMILSDTFRSPLWIALGIATAIGGLINLSYVHHLKAAAQPRLPDAPLPST